MSFTSKLIGNLATKAVVAAAPHIARKAKSILTPMVDQAVVDAKDAVQHTRGTMRTGLLAGSRFLKNEGMASGSRFLEKAADVARAPHPHEQPFPIRPCIVAEIWTNPQRQERIYLYADSSAQDLRDRLARAPRGEDGSPMLVGLGYSPMGHNGQSRSDVMQISQEHWLSILDAAEQGDVSAIQQAAMTGTLNPVRAYLSDYEQEALEDEDRPALEAPRG